MRRIPRFKVRSLKLRQANLRGWMQILPVLLYLLGITAGAICEEIGRAHGQTYAQYFVTQFLQIHLQSSLVGIIGFSFLSGLLLQTAVLFFGFSCVGVPVVLCIPMLKGFTDGCLSGFLYGSMGLRGLAANLLLFWAPQVGQAALLLSFTARILPMTVTLYRCNLLQKTPDRKLDLESPLRFYLFSALGVAAVSMGSGALSYLFAAVFLTACA